MSNEIDFETEELLTLSKAARGLPPVRGDKPPHHLTLLRWALDGLISVSGKRVKLETVFVGRTRMTSMAALKRFFARLNDVEYMPLPESAESEQKALEEQAAESLRRMQSKGLIGP